MRKTRDDTCDDSLRLQSWLILWEAKASRSRDRIGRAGTDWPGKAGPGAAWQGRRGWEAMGPEWQARPDGASTGSAGLQGLGAKALGAAGSPGLGITWRGLPRQNDKNSPKNY